MTNITLCRMLRLLIILLQFLLLLLFNFFIIITKTYLQINTFVLSPQEGIMERAYFA